MIRRKTCKVNVSALLVTGIFGFLALSGSARAQGWQDDSWNRDHDAPHHAKIKSFSVEQTEETLAYPSYLVDIPDEHTTLLPQWPWANPWPEHGPVNYLLFASSAVTGSIGWSGCIGNLGSEKFHFWRRPGLCRAGNEASSRFQKLRPRL